MLNFNQAYEELCEKTSTEMLAFSCLCDLTWSNWSLVVTISMPNLKETVSEMFSYKPTWDGGRWGGGGGRGGVGLEPVDYLSWIPLWNKTAFSSTRLICPNSRPNLVWLKTRRGEKELWLFVKIKAYSKWHKTAHHNAVFNHATN